MKNISFENVILSDGFWKSKKEMTKNVTVDAVYNRFVDTLRFWAFDCSYDPAKDEWAPHFFWDSDVAKWIEGVSYLLIEERDERLEKIIDDVVEKIEKHRNENGYFNSHFLVVEKDQIFKIRDRHELYCMGHLIEAAIAYKRATGKGKFLKIMCEFADYADKCFRTEKTAEFTTPGHPEVELALVKLYRETGEKRYLDLAKYFIDMKGHCDPDRYVDIGITGDVDYNNDNCTMRERTNVTGHAVRALYLYSGAADVAYETGDAELSEACKNGFYDISRKMYVTGGTGSTNVGEKLTHRYDLPNSTAYAETCASIAMALFCERMQKLDVDSKYADTYERAIYNGVLAGISLGGEEFFYENPLEIDLEENKIRSINNARSPITQRVKIFGCSCCPPNLVRFFPSIADGMYTYDDETVYVHQYIASKCNADGIELEISTEYPKNGAVKIKGSTGGRKIAVRIPAWCDSFDISKPYEIKNGYAYIDFDGEIDINFEMKVRVVYADGRVKADIGKICVTRGPVVYCLEGVDNGGDLRRIRLDPKTEFKVEDEEYSLAVITADAFSEDEREDVYGYTEPTYTPIRVKFIPYHAYANRGETNMKVWIDKK